MNSQTTFAQEKKFSLPHGKSYFLLSIIISLILIFGTWAAIMFIPELILKPIETVNHGCRSFFDAFNYEYILQTGRATFNLGLYAGGIIFWIFNAILLLSLSFFGWTLIRTLILILIYPKWFNYNLNEHAKIINSCNGMNINDKVAMVVPTCNDFLPNTILQTAKQTYKNIDIWITDDSSKPEVIAKIDEFCAQHGYHVLHRDPEHKKNHPTKVGNLYYFLEKIGDRYDYVFENDSSSIVTPTFVEHCMCYFKTPLWDHDKDGGIISNGSFYGSKNLISFLNSKCIQLSEAMFCGGGANQLLGGPVMINGWGAMYKISTLKKIPLETVECPICDSARGLWLTLNNYQNYLNPFDFTAKLSPQTMEGFKNQKLKWNGGDVFLFRNGLINSKYSNWKANVYVKSFAWPIDIMIPLSFFLTVINAILTACLNFFYFNLTMTLFLAAVGIVMVVAILIAMVINKCDILLIILSIVGALMEAAITYRRVWQIVVRGYIKHTWSSGAVTTKATIRTNIKQRFRMCLLDGIVLAIGLTVCLLLQFLTNILPFIIWFNIFTLLIGPSIVYIILVWFGEIRVRIGYDDKMEEYDFWLHDFRYKHVKETEIWKKEKNRI